MLSVAKTEKRDWFVSIRLLLDWQEDSFSRSALGILLNLGVEEVFKHFCVGLVFNALDSSLMVFCSRQCTMYSAVDFMILATIWSCSQNQHLLGHFCLVSATSLAKISRYVKPNVILDLRGIFYSAGPYWPDWKSFSTISWVSVSLCTTPVILPSFVSVLSNASNALFA